MKYVLRQGILWVGLFTIGFLRSTGLQAANGPIRNWKTHPAIVEIDTKDDIYVIGDIHGDYERFISLLVVHKLIAEDPPEPGKAVWNAGKATLVCTGDIIDKGDQALRVIALFQTLKMQAEKAGGHVVVCSGNHEAEFLASEGKSKKTLEFGKELQKANLNLEEVIAAKDGRGIGSFLRSLPFGCRVNDWFFIHAGETQGKTLVQLRDEFEKSVDEPGYKVLIAIGSPLEARMQPQPWWERKGEKAEDGKNRLAKQVKALGVRHLVIGHAPGEVEFADGTSRKKGEMVQKFDGLIFLIDVGMSRAVGYSTGVLLHIHTDNKQVTATALRPDKTSNLLWRTK